MKTALSRLLAAAAIAAGLTGCVEHNAERVARLDNTNDFVVTDLRSVRTNGLLNVAATVQNTSSTPETVLYRFSWRTDNYISDETNSWTPQLIYGGQWLQLSGVAPNPSITDFTLELSK